MKSSPSLKKKIAPKDLENPKKLKPLVRDNFGLYCALTQDDDHFEPVHSELCDFIQDEIETQEEPCLLVVMPRGSLKTTIVTRRLPEWLAIRDPDIRVLNTSNNLPNAKDKIRAIRGTFQHDDMVRSLFTEVIPDNYDDVAWSDERIELKRKSRWSEPTFTAAGVRTRIEGKHYNVVIEDDTMAPDQSGMTRDIIIPTRSEVDSAVGWHKFKAMPILVNIGKRIRIVVTTRWGYHDLVNYIEENEPWFSVFDVPAVGMYRTRKNEEWSKHGKDGAYNFPGLLPDDRLNRISDSLGKYMFSALYLNAPMLPEDMTFQEEWIHMTDDVPDDCEWVVTIDPAISQSDDACETAIVRGGHKRVKVSEKEYRAMLYVDNGAHGRFTPQSTISKSLQMVEFDYENTKWIGVESIAYQESLAYFMRDEMKRREIFKPIQKIKSRQSKVERIMALQPFFENGQIIIRNNAFGKALRTQLLTFMPGAPGAQMLDIIDALAMQLLSYPGIKMGSGELPENKARDTVGDYYDELVRLKRPDPLHNPTGLGGRDLGSIPLTYTGLHGEN